MFSAELKNNNTFLIFLKIMSVWNRHSKSKDNFTTTHNYSS